jgi:cyclophilin family peptidyl-prolyl cis-trans isomerase
MIALGVILAIIALTAIVLLVRTLPTQPAATTGTPLAQSQAPTGDRPLAAKPPAERNNAFSTPPPMTIDPNKTYTATIATEVGDIVIRLFADKAPKTVNNFVFLARQGFYDGTTFHRVLEGFMAQGGDPTGTGTGGPGYQFEDETNNGLVFDKPGLLAMANAGPNTNGSQFFITFVPTPWLNGKHTIFGEVVQGIGVLGKIRRRDPTQNPTFTGTVIDWIDIQEGP